MAFGQWAETRLRPRVRQADQTADQAQLGLSAQLGERQCGQHHLPIAFHCDRVHPDDRYDVRLDETIFWREHRVLEQ